jgi:hypothetical protein
MGFLTAQTPIMSETNEHFGSRADNICGSRLRSDSSNMVCVGGYGSINTSDPKQGSAPFRRKILSSFGLASAILLMALVALVSHLSQLSLLQDERIPIVSKVYDDTGRYLSPAAIASTAIFSHGGTSSDELAVLETAAGLKQPRRYGHVKYRDLSGNYLTLDSFAKGNHRGTAEPID